MTTLRLPEGNAFGVNETADGTPIVIGIEAAVAR